MHDDMDSRSSRFIADADGFLGAEPAEVGIRLHKWPTSKPGGGTHGFNTIQCIPLSVLRTSRSFLSSGNVNGRRVSLIHHPASVFDLDMIQDHNLSAPTLPRQRSSRILSLTF